MAIIATFALGLSSAACGNASGNSGSTAGSNGKPTLTFMLDWTPNTNHVGLYVAQQLGYFKDAGINVKILPTAQAGAETSVQNGVANIGFSKLTDLANADAHGADLKLVFDLTQKPIARWCSLKNRNDIKTPKDFAGKTFVTFGSAEQSASVRQMIRYAGGSGDFKTATAGTNTFRTLTSGKGDFAGFYANWEEVESQLNGPALNCFAADKWGVPGNPDQLGFAVKNSWLKNPQNTANLKKFLKAARRGYDYALAHPDKAADILVSQTKTSHLDPKLARASMEKVVREGYWSGNGMGDETTSGKPNQKLTGTVNTADGQKYLDFQYHAGTYTGLHEKKLPYAPQATELSTNKYVQ
ncbi:ABC transporter substrate-binding protein [Bifidobacterium sp. ESL0764]|uniref:ABC transporter substrate-binding protein n=1 Tax=Bifidobacterium sp. ESL0764 TaxID=2983228 RepID=UPI0023F8624E|nr:ABC transporter substrate-binding protein [Bifidobacterium sp. ESL0764]WEV65999.1 ABC transporter substrate-binding protein [Bifidobacterium sp. ESL0764]